MTMEEKLRKAEEKANMYRRQLGGVNAALDRARQHERELEAENEQLRRLLAGRYGGGGQ